MKTSTLQPKKFNRLFTALAIAAGAASLAGCGPNTPQNPAVGQQPVAGATATATAPAVAPNDGPAPVVVQGQPVPQAAPAYAPPPAPSQRVAAAQPNYAQPAYSPPAYSPPAYAPPAPRVVAHAPSDRVGRVSSIEPIRERPQGTGAGGVVGGVLGAVVGNQFGHGHGRTAMTVLGAAGGAVAGNNVERNIHERIVAYRINVVLDDGASRSYEETNLAGLRVGDRVRADSNGVRRM